MKSLINKKACKEFALECAKGRFHKFTRCSKNFLERMEMCLKTTIRLDIQSMPSKGKTLLGFILCLGLCSQAFAHPINMKILAEIESSNNPNACSYRGCKYGRGTYQISEIVLKQYLSDDARPQFMNATDWLDKDKFTPEKLFDPKVNKFIANYYLSWLHKYTINHYDGVMNPEWVDDVLISWNWGPNNWRKWNEKSGAYKDLPKETQDFLKKYHEKELEKQKL